MRARIRSVRLVLVMMGLIAIGVAPLLTEQAPVRQRLGRPRDWSHAHVVAARGGPDHGLSIYKDWRTLFRHMEIDQVLAAREAQKKRGFVGSKPSLLNPIPGRKQRLPLYALWLALPVVAWVGLARRKKSKWGLWLAIACLAALGSMTGCGRSGWIKSLGNSGFSLDWSLNTGGFGNVISFPAKFSFDITASNCSDVIYFTVDQPGGLSTVNVIAITNPYAGCPGNTDGSTPTVKFGIALGNGTAISAVLSLDGTVLYVMESRPSTSGGAILHAINVNNITSSPGTYNFGTGTWTSTHTLAAPTGGPGSEQLFELVFAGVDNVRSSPYLDYTNNQIFFGDSQGRVHRVINTNTTTASEDATNFPVACGTAELRSPVFVNGQVIVTSADGKVYRIDTTIAPPFTCVASAAVGTGSATGELTPPVIDVTNSKIIVVTGRDAASQWQMALFALDFPSGASPLSSAIIGKENAFSPRIPGFDNAFLTTNTGNLYVGGTPSGGGKAYLIRVPYNGSTFSAPAGFARLRDITGTGGSGNGQQSHATVFLTASTLANPEFVYIAGVKEYNFMNRIGSGFAGTDASPVTMDSFSAGVGGVDGGIDSGIIIDNRTAGVTGPTATANIYYGTMAKPGTFQSTVVQLAQEF